MRRWLAIGLMACMVSEARAADFSIGSFVVSLGADKATLLKDAQSRYRLIPVQGNPNLVFLSERQPSGRVVGSVTFTGEKLTAASRNWGSFTGREAVVDVGKALFGAVESVISQTDQSAIVSTKTHRIPGAEFKSIYYEFPGRRIYVTITDADAANGGKQLSVEESIFVPK
jgi:hypothetical protein